MKRSAQFVETGGPTEVLSFGVQLVNVCVSQWQTKKKQTNNK